MRQVEEALDELYQKTYVGKTHSLLTPELLKIKTSQELYGSAGPFSPPDARGDSLHHSVGALSLSSQPTLSAEYMSRNSPPPSPDVALDILQLSTTFPFPWAVDVNMCQRIREALPPRAVAQRICEEARNNALWPSVLKNFPM